MIQHFPHHHDVAAVLPYYDENGDSTKMFLKNGDSRILKLRIRTVINRLARANATDLKALKNNVARATQSSHHHVLPLTPELVLIPVKTRQPRVGGDSATGYINFHAIRTISAVNRAQCKAAIVLTGGQVIDSLWSAKTVEKYLRLARLAISQPTYTSVAETPEFRAVLQKMAETLNCYLAHKIAPL